MNDRKFRLNAALLLVWLWLPHYATKAEDPSENLVLVSLDGVRWQEVFGGVDFRLSSVDVDEYANVAVAERKRCVRRA